MWIKICGIQSPEAALCCAEAGADAVGLVFAESRRKVSVEQAADIIQAIPPGIEKVGVFVNQAYSEVNAIDKFLGFDLLQFHGDENPHYCRKFPGRVLKSFRVKEIADLAGVNEYRDCIKACLLDNFEAGQAGGTGKAWDWRMLSNSLYQELAGFKLIVAGGLTADNVKAALDQLNPYGVDVSSGVERAGQKDSSLIRNFVNKVRRWEDVQSA